MTSKWKAKKKAKRQEELATKQAQTHLVRAEAERERIRRYNRAWRTQNLAKVAERQRRWRAKKGMPRSLNVASTERT